MLHIVANSSNKMMQLYTDKLVYTQSHSKVQTNYILHEYKIIEISQHKALLCTSFLVKLLQTKLIQLISLYKDFNEATFNLILK